MASINFCLNFNGISYVTFILGHLHSGNILIENDRIKLIDIENGVLGVPSYYRPYFMQHKKISSLESIDIYCFGHVLYEMAIGSPLHESYIIEDISECSQQISEYWFLVLFCIVLTNVNISRKNYPIDPIARRLQKWPSIHLRPSRRPILRSSSSQLNWRGSSSL